jgi:hypothetical protein
LIADGSGSDILPLMSGRFIFDMALIAVVALFVWLLFNHADLIFGQ